MIKVAVCGGFDPFPHRGHRNHFQRAKELGDHLIVLLNSDEFLLRKKGLVCVPFEDRKDMLLSLRWVDEVVAVIDTDQTVAKTLRIVRPTILAKGGDRTPGNMPAAEIDACKDIGCEIRYGVCSPDAERYSTGSVLDILIRAHLEAR